MQSTTKITSKGLQLSHLVRTSLITFIFLCIIIMALLMLSLGFLLQLGALLGPWLITTGWAALKGAILLLGVFRLTVLLVRSGMTIHRQWACNTKYREALLLIYGTMHYLWKSLLWLLIS